MRRIHLFAGAVALAAFLITGQFMRRHHPPMPELSDALRLMFRSRHINILAAALVNLMLGVYLDRQTSGWRRRVQDISSGLVLIAPALLIAAFLTEPGRNIGEELLYSKAGLYALFGGCMGHLVSARHFQR